MEILGGSIVEAIDWVQDKLATTRPLAETTLFSLIANKKVKETDRGFMLLLEAEDEVHDQHTKQVSRGARPHGKRARVSRKRTRQRRSSKMKHMVKQTDSVEVVSDEVAALSELLERYSEADDAVS